MIQHTEDCNDLMTGRALRQLIDQDLRIRSISLAELNSRRDMMRAHEDEGRCDCARLALGRTENALRVLRKRMAAASNGAMERDAAELKAQRDELRAIVAGDR